MEKINWMKEVEERKENMLRHLQSFLQIKSVLNEEDATADAPLGVRVKEALDFLLETGEKDGFIAKNVDNLAGHLEFGTGEELIGILCHVDVVPEGDGWTVNPFGGEIKEGKIYARGAIDDKGPTMAAYYAMKIVKELDAPLSKRVRMIIGTDEESDWRCVDRYFKTEEMPDAGFAPDADFPIIYAEKGIADYDIVQKKPVKETATRESVVVQSFQSGRRYNMVPDYAKAIVQVNKEQTELIQRYNDFLREKEIDGRYHVDGGFLILEMIGKSVHGMEPDLGKSAGLYLARFLAEFELDKQADHYFQFVKKYVGEESRGKALGLNYQDDITGELTINVGKLSYSAEHGGELGINMRYPVTFKLENKKLHLETLLNDEGFCIENFTDSPPHHVDEDAPLIKTLAKVYEEQTGEKAELLSIGGGTYARSLKNGVAYGALFPGRDDVAHQRDEYMHIEDLLKATAIYAQAIYELASDQ